MARLPQPGCCCGETPNCMIRMLVASKSRCGFPALYITDIVTGSSKRSKLRFLQKSIDYTFTNTANSSADRDYHCAIEIVETKTGKVAYSETSSPGNASTLATNRSAAVSTINSQFGTWKDSAPGTYVSGYTTTVVAFTYESTEGVDIVYAHINIVTAEPGFGTQTTDWEVTLATEYPDYTTGGVDGIADQINDLLANYDTGSGNGLDGVTDNTLVYINWNENGVISYLGDSSGGSCAIDPTTLDAYTTTADPEIEIDTWVASMRWGATGQWWQHTGGGAANGETELGEEFSIYDCSFTADTSMPNVFGSADDWSSERTAALRFNVGTPVCMEEATVDGAATTGTRCTLETPTVGHVDIFQPHPETISNSNILTTTAWEFTAPGDLTSGDCPCTTAP